MAPLDTGNCSGSVKLILGMWQDAQDCPAGLDISVSKKSFFPKVWVGLRIASGSDSDEDAVLCDF
ncbi:MAG: hypothetical protein WAT91_02050 [Saprospiraceae bacterium]